MEFYLFITILLIILAIVDLTVGVANDAVNFVNASVGSRVSTFKTIIIFSAVGILIGVLLSSGMMEIARKGIFNPQYFTMPEIMIIFVAVMLTDVLMLDLFNTLGLPTSTTVSIIFELLGASVAVSVIKMLSENSDMSVLFQYINTASVLKIIIAIFTSIIVAFTVGLIFQFVTRLLFTFDYHRRIKRYGSIWGGLALTFITFFVIVKGAKGASFMTDELSAYIQTNLYLIVGLSFVFWTLILTLIQIFTRINIFKVIVLIGTSALAMAFASNDLVNFIGAPLAGLMAYQFSLQMDDPLNTTMGILNQPLKADTFLLLIAGLIMIATLLFSMKVRSVVNTSVRLGRQEEGYERFESNLFARGLVRIAIIIFEFIKKLVPPPILNFIQKRLDTTKYKPELDSEGKAPAFDLVRAAVILSCSSGLISFATSLKLPLSTTYVTFIVAMAAALADKAWDRDSAVYRVAGVLTVIGGWLLSALIAFTVSFIIAVIIYYGNIYAIIAISLFVAFSLVRTNSLHKKLYKESEEIETKLSIVSDRAETLIKIYYDEILKFLNNILKAIEFTLKGIQKGSIKQLTKAKAFAKLTNKQLPILHNDILRISKYDNDDSADKSLLYGKVLSSLNSITDHLSYLSNQNLTYFDNNHTKFTDVQLQELNILFSSLIALVQSFKDTITNKTVKDGKEFNVIINEINSNVKKFYDNQLKRFRKSGKNLRRSRLFLDNISDIEAITNNLELIKKLTDNLFYEKFELVNDLLEAKRKGVVLIEDGGKVSDSKKKSKG